MKTILCACVCLFLSITYNFAQSQDERLNKEMNSFIAGKGENAGLIYGIYNLTDNNIKIQTVGAIEKNNDLRLACPASKPCISYLTLKSGLNLNQSINQWFPKDKGYTKSDSITIIMLLLNTSGIKDYIQLIPVNPDTVITIDRTIECAYNNQNLLFNPGKGFEYSNTNFNILGRILESKTKTSLNQLIKINFGSISPSLRIDDGNGVFPKGYTTPWPFHYTASGYAGGLIGTAEDVMRVFAYISKTPEFKIMTKGYNTDGSIDEKCISELGLGIFLDSDFKGLGKAVLYDGNMMACQMLIIEINNKIYYLHTTFNSTVPLKDLAAKLIRIANE